MKYFKEHTINSLINSSELHTDTFSINSFVTQNIHIKEINQEQVKIESAETYFFLPFIIGFCALFFIFRLSGLKFK